MAIFAAFHVFGARLDGRFHHMIAIAHTGAIDDLALALEHKPDRACLAQAAAVFGKGRAHIRRGAVAVIGHRLDNHRHTIGAIALVADLFIGITLATDGLFDGALDVLFGHRIGFRLFHHQTQTRVFVGVGITHFGGDGDLFGQFRKQLCTNRILPPLAVLDVRPF